MITDNIYEQLTLKMLVTFELSHGTMAFHLVDKSQFQVFGTLHQMSFTDFFIWLIILCGVHSNSCI